MQGTGLNPIYNWYGMITANGFTCEAKVLQISPSVLLVSAERNISSGSSCRVEVTLPRYVTEGRDMKLDVSGKVLHSVLASDQFRVTIHIHSINPDGRKILDKMGIEGVGDSISSASA